VLIALQLTDKRIPVRVYNKHETSVCCHFGSSLLC
jgi:hypothetical protein